MKNLIPKKLSDWFWISILIIVVVIPILFSFWYEPMRMLEELLVLVSPFIIGWIAIYFKKPEQ